MTAKVFITTYSLYSQGRQFESDQTGFWLNCADYDLDELTDNFNLVDPVCNNDHEFMFTDFEGFPDSLYSESGIDFETIVKWEYLESEQQIIVEVLLDNNYVSDISEAIEKCEECYIFEGDLADYAQEITESCYDIPGYLVNYINYEKMGNEMLYDGNIIDINNNQLLIMHF